MSSIVLSELPAPEVIQRPDYQALLDQLLDDYTQAMQRWVPGYDRPLEADPIYQSYTQMAYRLLNHEQRINDAALAVMPAYARGADLDHIAGWFGVQRLVIDPGDPNAEPPLPPTYEDDERFRLRVVLSPEGRTTAGSIGSYVYHALSASALVKDVAVESPQPCEIVLTLLSSEPGNGRPSPQLLASVSEAVSARYVRPFGDRVTVQPAQIVEYAIQATLTLSRGPAASVVLDAAQKSATAYVTEAHRLQRQITEASLLAAIHQPGVHDIALSAPTALPISPDKHQAAYCTSVNIQLGEVLP